MDVDEAIKALQSLDVPYRVTPFVSGVVTAEGVASELAIPLASSCGGRKAASSRYSSDRAIPELWRCRIRDPFVAELLQLGWSGV